MTGGTSFKITLEQNWMKKDWILYTGSQELIVLTDSKRKWYKLLLQIITIGLYRAPYEYLVKPL
jgi:hypothetical protein